MGLAKELQTNAVEAVRKQILDGLEAEISKLETARAERWRELTRQRDEAYKSDFAEIDSKRKALAVIRTALASFDVPPTRKTTDLFFLDSRTSPLAPGKGHWMEVMPGMKKVRCSCSGFQYRGSCWASDHINQNLAKSRPDRSWPYVTYDDEYRVDSDATRLAKFDSRKRPSGSSTRPIIPAFLNIR